MAGAGAGVAPAAPAVPAGERVRVYEGTRVCGRG